MTQNGMFSKKPLLKNVPLPMLVKLNECLSTGYGYSIIALSLLK